MRRIERIKGVKAMAEVTTYAGIVLPVSSAEGEKLQIKGRSVNDTHFTYEGNVTHNRLIPRTIGAYCNTYTAMQEGSSFRLNSRAAEIILVATAEQKPCLVSVDIDGNVSQVQAHSGVFLRCRCDGEKSIKLTVLEGELRFDRAILTGRNAAVTLIDGANEGYIIASPGFERRGDSIVGSTGEYAEIYSRGSEAAVTLDGNGRMRIMCAGADRYVNIDCERTVHIALEDKDNFNRIRLEVCSGEIVIVSLRLADTTSVVSVMNDCTDKELDDMKNGKRGFIPVEQWQPVKCLRVPMNNVELCGGVLADRFARNINYLKKSLELPRWVDKKDDDRIWIDMLVASNEGRMLAGMGNTLRYKEVPAFRKAVSDMLDEVERRQFTNDNGYCLPYESSLFAISHDCWPGFMRDEIKNYDRTMFTKGLIAAGYAGYDGAWQIIRKFYDWYNNCEYLPDMLLGSMGIQGSAAGPRVQSSPAGKPEDIITNMKYYDMDWWLDYLAREIPEAVWRFTLNRPHNYLLTSICALFDIYAATGAKKYLDAAVGAYHIYRDYFMLPGSFITICEHFECKPGTHKISNVPNSIFETCAGVFLTELAQRLLSADPDNEEYALRMEESIYNLTCSCQGEDGRIRYFNHMNGVKYPALRYNTCCEIQGTGFIGQIQSFLYLLSDRGVQVNVFAPSKIAFSVDGRDFELEQHTTFPYGDKMRFTVHGEGEFELRMRIPSWSRNTVLTVCGEEIPCTPGSFAVISRAWKDGDEVVLKTARELRMELYTGENRAKQPRYCISCGPVLMSVVGEGEHAELGNDERCALLPFAHTELLGRLKKSGTMEYDIQGTEYRLVPYFSFDDNREFTCYPAFEEEV